MSNRIGSSLWFIKTIGTTLTLAISAAVQMSPIVACADIFKWEYINPANPGQGKQQSTTLAPDGAGVDAVPGANLRANFSMAYLVGKDLTGAFIEGANLTNAELSQANLTGAHLASATLGGANFTGALVQGANFISLNPTLTAAQLYSTASYQAHDLTGIGLGENIMIGWNFAGQNLSSSNLYDAFLSGANLSQANLTGAYSVLADVRTAILRQANLTNANFTAAELTNANFTGADVRGASFYRPTIIYDYYSEHTIYGTGLTLPQLISTASYQTHDMTGTNLGYNYLPGGNFAGFNLTNAGFSRATLTNADFSQADLTDASFYDATLTGANFTGAHVQGAYFGVFYYASAGLTAAQLYSTASYQARNLTGIFFTGKNLSGWNFIGQNLTHADLGQTKLANGEFTQANLTNADFDSATLANVNLTAADTRGAKNLVLSGTEITANLIRPDGHIAGIDLSAGKQLVIRDYDGDPSKGQVPVAILVDSHFAMGPGGILEIRFESDAWDSTISFDLGISVVRGGALELLFADGTDASSQIGRTFKLFDWTGVAPTGAFSVSSPYVWDLSNLYITGEVTLTAVPEPAASVVLTIAAVGWCLRRRGAA